MKKTEDSILVEKARMGDSDAFGELVARHAEAVKGYCYYRCGNFEESRDLCQEAFVLAYTKLHQLKDPAKFSAWIRTIASNTCSRWLRSRREIPSEDIEVSATASESPTASLVRDALSSLPDNERLAVVMHYVDGLSYGDIAEFLEVSEGAVRGRLYRGREMLKKEFITMAEEEFGKYRVDSHFTEQTIALTRSFTRLGLGWSPDGENILFLRYFEDHGVQLWISNTHGADAQPVSEIGWQENYGWSPDSKRVVYAYAPARRNDQPGSFHLYELGGASRMIASGFKWTEFEDMTGWAKPVWSGDSKKVALLMRRETDSPGADAFIFHLETGERTALTPAHHHTGRMHVGDWLPDDKRFVVASNVSPGSNARIWVCDSDGRDIHPITSEDLPIASDPRRRPKCDEIAFCAGPRLAENAQSDELSVLGSGHWADLWTMKPDGSGLQRITDCSSSARADQLGFGNPEWTSDGQYVVCLTRRADEGGHECQGIHIVHVDTGEVIRVMESDPRSGQHVIGFRNKISICPNGKRIAFTVGQFKVDDRSKKIPAYSVRQDVLYFYDIPSRRLHEVQRTRPEQDGTLLLHCGYNWMPLWSPDGTRLLCTKGKVTDLSDWDRSIGPEGRLVQALGSMWDELTPRSENHLCFFEIGD